jgi:hypothetical protein
MQTMAHDYRNARQSLVLLDHARRAGLARTFAAGMARIDEVERVIRAHKPDASEASEHLAALEMIEALKSRSAYRPSRSA